MHILVACAELIMFKKTEKKTQRIYLLIIYVEKEANKEIGKLTFVVSSKLFSANSNKINEATTVSELTSHLL